MEQERNIYPTILVYLLGVLRVTGAVKLQRNFGENRLYSLKKIIWSRSRKYMDKKKVMDKDLKICTKTRYESRQEAQANIYYLESKDPEVDLRTYKCHTCHNWHLTSKR